LPQITTFVDLQILQIADERHEAELYQKDEDIRQKNTLLEVRKMEFYVQWIYIAWLIWDASQ
jgi:hypothetical protein